MSNTFDFVAIGDITTDAFIRLQQAKVIDNIDHTSKELCINFGDKVPYEFVKIVRGVGNSANASVAAARLGLRSALIADVGEDQNGKECIGAVRESNVSIDYVRLHKEMESNYHYVLWYDVERTILVKHQEFPYALPVFSAPPTWVYLSSLGHHSLSYHQEIAEYLKANPTVKLAFQPGTFQMQFGVEALKDIYERSDIFFCNTDEARRILKSEEKDIKKLLEAVSALGPKITIITDGIDGAYAYDKQDHWFIPIYPHKPYERTGAGDAFASTVTAAIALGKSLEEALAWGPINSMSVVQKIGAQEGLLTREQLEEYLKNAPAEYKPRKI